MEGIFLGINGECIEKVKKQTEELSLLAKGEGTEIMFQKIEKDTTFYIDPGDEKELMEFFYIIKGTVSYEKQGDTILLNQGDYFYVQDLNETVFLKTETKVELLYVSNQPVFHFLSDEINKLLEMQEQVLSKDMYTHEHNVRLKDYSVRIGEKLKLSKSHLNMLYYSAALHDIGKINVPDEILNKPGSLTKEEFELIKKHSVDGAEIIKKTFLKDASDIVLQHHERIDGTGYPKGIKGNEICIEAKIIAVVDTFDAMTSDRPYRKALDPIDSLNEIKSLIGRHYDESVVLALEEVLKEDKVV